MYKGLTDYGDFRSRMIKKSEKKIEMLSAGIEFRDGVRAKSIENILNFDVEKPCEEKFVRVKRLLDERADEVEFLDEEKTSLEYHVEQYLKDHPEEKVKIEESEGNADGRE